MPQDITLEINGKNIATTCATEEELLAFANKIRLAGGANVLEALIPSHPSHSYYCLIANALNFSCRVSGADSASERFSDGSYRWAMHLPENMGSFRAAHIAAQLDLDYDMGCHEILLPKNIGNAAHAFDRHIAFHDLVLADSDDF